jgi:hypothetical protein
MWTDCFIAMATLPVVELSAQVVAAVAVAANRFAGRSVGHVETT